MAQLPVPLLGLQPTPQAPQLVFVSSWVSQPFEGSPSQSPQPALQAMAHFPETQLAVPFVELHALPHAPQFNGSVSVLVSQPFEASPSQSP